METVFLILTIVMPPNMPDIVHRMPESSIDQCWKDAKEFTALEKPKINGAQGVMAACFTKIVLDGPT